MATSLSSRVLITGASSGIGLATALLLSRSGCKVVGTARNPAATRVRLEEKLGAALPFSLIEMDMHDAASIERGAEAALAELGGIDIPINNAGEGELGSVEDTDLSDSRKLFETNFFSVVQLVKKVLPAMRTRGEG